MTDVTNAEIEAHMRRRSCTRAVAETELGMTRVTSGPGVIVEPKTPTTVDLGGGASMTLTESPPDESPLAEPPESVDEPLDAGAVEDVVVLDAIGVVADEVELVEDGDGGPADDREDDVDDG